MPMPPPAKLLPSTKYHRNVNSSPASLHAIAGVASKPRAKEDCFYGIHKVPSVESPYGRAKHVQLVEKDPNGASPLFWAAINAGDRVDNALKDMAIVMKQDRSQEAIEAIKSFRHRCSEQAQESLDNVLIDSYKKCGSFDEQIALLKHKVRLIQVCVVFNGKLTKTARSHGKKSKVSIDQETTRLLGNLGWAYMQRLNFGAAEAVYRKAQLMEEDGNKACNLGLCLIKQGKLQEAATILKDVIATYPKSLERAECLLKEIELSYNKANGIHSSSTTSFCEGGKCHELQQINSGKMSSDKLSYSDMDEEEANAWWLDGGTENNGGLEEWALQVSAGGEILGGLARKRNRLPVFEEITPLKKRS